MKELFVKQKKVSRVSSNRSQIKAVFLTPNSPQKHLPIKQAQFYNNLDPQFIKRKTPMGMSFLKRGKEVHREGNLEEIFFPHNLFPGNL